MGGRIFTLILMIMFALSFTFLFSYQPFQDMINRPPDYYLDYIRVIKVGEVGGQFIIALGNALQSVSNVLNFIQEFVFGFLIDLVQGIIDFFRDPIKAIFG